MPPKPTPRSDEHRPAFHLFTALQKRLAVGLFALTTGGLLPTLHADEPPMKASELAISIQENAVAAPPKAKTDKSVTKIRSLMINLRRIGPAGAHVTLKTCFIGYDVASRTKVINCQHTVEAEASKGAGNTYTETSDPFTYFPSDIDPKTQKPVPASGTKPAGWVLRIYQGNTLVASRASAPDLIAWISSQ